MKGLVGQSAAASSNSSCQSVSLSECVRPFVPPLVRGRLSPGKFRLSQLSELFNLHRYWIKEIVFPGMQSR